MPRFSGRRATDPETFTALRRGVVGDYREWGDACRLAFSRGWTLEEVDSVLFWYHPMTWFWLGFYALALVAIALSILG